MQLTQRFLDALVFAFTLHQTQRRKGTDTPYFSHLMVVSATVLENGGTEDQAIAALLHDAVEDQGDKTSLEEIESKFGSGVSRIVKSCSDSIGDPKTPWQKRKERYVENLAMESHDVLLVSISDKLHNARAILHDYQAIGERIWERFSVGPDEILWYYRSLVSAFQAAKVNQALLYEFEDTLNRIIEIRSHNV